MKGPALSWPRIGSGLLIPAVGDLPSLIGKNPEPLDLGRIVDTRWQPHKICLPLQQRGGIGRSDQQGICRLHHALLQQRRAIHRLRGTL